MAITIKMIITTKINIVTGNTKLTILKYNTKLQY